MLDFGYVLFDFYILNNKVQIYIKAYIYIKSCPQFSTHMLFWDIKCSILLVFIFLLFSLLQNVLTFSKYLFKTNKIWNSLVHIELSLSVRGDVKHFQSWFFNTVLDYALPWLCNSSLLYILLILLLKMDFSNIMYPDFYSFFY